MIGEKVSEKVVSMTKYLDNTIQSVRRISSELRPSLLDNLSLQAAIEWKAQEFQDRTGVECQLTFDPEDIVLDQDLATAIFRIFQEALTNIGRHANATEVKVSLKEQSGELVMEIRDNGIGISKKQIADSQSFGLLGMKERVHSFGGEFSIRGAKGKGTRVQVRVPLDNQ